MPLTGGTLTGGLEINSPSGQSALRAIGTTSSLLIGNVGSGENYYDAGSFHQFQIRGVEKFSISSAGNAVFAGSLSGTSATFSGNIGIGTDNLSEKLNVNGNIRARAVKVSPEGWPDYVFEQSYKLPDLKVTEQFIKENKHLPEVPSAKEVQTNGIELGQMNAMLLKKIEELTLYLIELKKDNEKIKEDNRMQQREINQLKNKK